MPPGGRSSSSDPGRIKAVLHWIRRHGRRIVVTVAGFLVVILGVLMSLPLVPGPGLLVVLLGLAILATEYAWARRALDKAKKRAGQAARRIGRIGRAKPQAPKGQ